MSWNGSGVYSLPALYFPEAPGNLVDSDRYNGTLQDIATGLNVALTKNGQNVATANLPMGGFKHTGVGAATTSGEYLSYAQAIDLPAAARLGLLAIADVSTVAGVSIANYGVTLGGTHTGFGGPGLALSGYYGILFATFGQERMRLNNTGNLVMTPPASPPALTGNGEVVMNFTSNTNFRISARGSDGVTRVANITLA